MVILTQADHVRVTQAVATAEAASDGEIVTIVAAQSDAYHDVALHYAVLAMLFVPALIGFVPERCIDWALNPFLGWNATLDKAALMLLAFVGLVVAFLVARFVLEWRPLRTALTPGATRSRRVRRRAVALFRAAAERRTTGRTGILIYLSMAEHRAEIVADAAIAGRVEPEVWGAAMEVLIDEVKAGRPGEGMARAVEAVGAVLAAHLPATGGNPNELPDRLIEL